MGGDGAMRHASCDISNHPVHRARQCDSMASGSQDDPLNLSISVSGGEENNNDSPSSGE